MKKRVATGIPGLDELVGGGFPEGSITMISGPPGIGKSILAMQYIHNGIAQGEPGIFLTIENNTDDVIEYAGNFGWDFKGYEEEGKLKIIDRGMFGETDLELGLDFGVLQDAMGAIKAKRLILDSVTLFNYMFKDEISRRLHMLRFMDLIKKHNCTSLMLSDQEENFLNVKYHEEHFLSDGLIFLFWSRHRAENERCIWTVKIRGSAVDTHIRPMRITEQGVVVYSKETPAVSVDMGGL
jgi:KaiC/GvpD/RAD55 family RecA-like ATPase